MKPHLSLASRLATSFALCSTLASAVPAFGQVAPDAWRGIYAGAGGSYSNVSVEKPGSYCSDCYYWDLPEYDEGNGDYSFLAHAGYRAGRYFAVEAGYVDGGTIGWEKPYVWMPQLGGYYRNAVDFDAEVLQLSAVAVVPFLERWEAYGRLGAGFWNGESEQTLTDVYSGEVIQQHASDDGVGLVAGLGLGITFARAWHARFEYQAVWIDGDALNVDSETTLDTFSLELQYRFGARNTAGAATGPDAVPP